MNSQMERYICKVWDGPECKNFCPSRVGVHHPPGMWICSSIWKHFKPHTMGIFMDESPHKHDWLTPFLAPLPSLEKWGWDWNFQDSNHVLVTVVTTPIQESSRSPPNHLIRTKDTPITQEILRDSAAWNHKLDQRSNIRERVFLAPSPLRELWGF